MPDEPHGIVQATILKKCGRTTLEAGPRIASQVARRRGGQDCDEDPQGHPCQVNSGPVLSGPVGIPSPIRRSAGQAAPCSTGPAAAP